MVVINMVCLDNAQQLFYLIVVGVCAMLTLLGVAYLIYIDWARRRIVPIDHEELAELIRLSNDEEDSGESILPTHTPYMLSEVLKEGYGFDSRYLCVHDTELKKYNKHGQKLNVITSEYPGLYELDSSAPNYDKWVCISASHVGWCIIVNRLID